MLIIVIIILLMFCYPDTIDVSWMPYDFNAEERLAAVVVPKVSRVSREKIRQSVILSKSNKSVFGSMYSVVSRAIKLNKYV